VLRVVWGEFVVERLTPGIGSLSCFCRRFLIEGADELAERSSGGV
jgi:hypothetical protein